MIRQRRTVVGGVVAAMLLPVLAACSLFGGESITLKVELADSSGLFVGNDVGVLGVPVGEVTAIEPKGDHVLVTLEVDADVKVPATAGAVVVSRSMATDRYVELTPAWSEGATIEDGTVIPSERTRTPVEWDEVLGAIDTLAEGLNGEGKDGKPIKRLINRTARLFDGNGAVVRDAITDLVSGTDVFASHRDDFVSALDSLDLLTSDLAENQRVAHRFIDNIARATALVDDEKQNLRTATESIAETIELLGVFVERHKDDLGGTADRIEDLSSRIMKHQTSFSEALRVFPVAMENVGNAVNARGRMDIKLPILMTLPGAQVISGLCGLLPAGLCDAIGPDLDLLAILQALAGDGGL